MSRPTNNMSEELFKVDGKTSVGETLPLALQHVVAMIVGCVTPAIICLLYTSHGTNRKREKDFSGGN